MDPVPSEPTNRPRFAVPRVEKLSSKQRGANERAGALPRATGGHCSSSLSSRPSAAPAIRAALPAPSRTPPSSPRHGEEEDENGWSARQGFTRSISDTIAFPHLFYMAHPQFPTPPAAASVTPSLSVVNLPSDLLPFKSVIAAWRGGGIMSRARREAAARERFWSVVALMPVMTSFNPQCDSFVTQGGRTRARRRWFGPQ